MSSHALSGGPLSLRAPVLVDALLPSVAWRDAAVVVAGALLVAAAAQIEIPLPFTPVPLSGQTFAVSLVGASLGSRRGALSLGLYVLLGALGAPFYAGGAGGLDSLLGPTVGYLVGFVGAASFIGYRAERSADRRPLSAFLSFLLGSFIIFGAGALGLMLTMDMSPGEALAKGVLPFIPGDLVKSALAAGLLPGTWKLVERFRG